MNLLVITTLLFAQATPKTVERYADGLQADMLPGGRVDKLVGFPGTCAFLIHAGKTKPAPLGKQSLDDWTKQHWKGVVIVMDFENDNYEGDAKAEKFETGWFANFPKNAIPIKCVRRDSTVIWGDPMLIERRYK